MFGDSCFSLLLSCALVSASPGDIVSLHLLCQVPPKNLFSNLGWWPQNTTPPSLVCFSSTTWPKTTPTDPWEDCFITHSMHKIMIWFVAVQGNTIYLGQFYKGNLTVLLTQIILSSNYGNFMFHKWLSLANCRYIWVLQGSCMLMHGSQVWNLFWLVKCVKIDARGNYLTLQIAACILQIWWNGPLVNSWTVTATENISVGITIRFARLCLNTK